MELCPPTLTSQSTTFLKLTLLFALIAAGGCSEGGPRRYPVSGTVTLDGQPVPEGRVRFVDPDMKQDADVGKITDGAFSFRSTPGPRRVQIMVPRETGELSDRGAPLYEEAVASEFSGDQSRLLVEVRTDGKNEYRFEVTSRPIQ